MMIKTKRTYEDPEESDGYRVLVDRMWPRGVSKDDAEIDYWAKDISPSDELRKWFGHDTEKWVDFKKKYKKELKDTGELKKLKDLVEEKKKLTLVYAAKDTEHNNAEVLKEVLD